MDATFQADLRRFGPEANHSPISLADARRYCALLTHRHYENFTVASILLPRRLKKHFHAIYAYCRWADDLGDETEGGETALRLLAWWRQELERCYDGRPQHPVMVALRETIRRFEIPPRPFLDLISAFEQDQRVQEYETIAQLVDYCTRSADPVGRLVLYLSECFDERRARLSDRVCTGLQLANFWQDVNRDLDIGRVYLPAEDRRRFGYTDADLRERRFTPEFAELLRFEVDRARRLFHEGQALIPLVPGDVQIDIELFLQGGLAILSKIEEIDYNVWRTRPVLTKREKLGLVARVGWGRVRRWLA